MRHPHTQDCKTRHKNACYKRPTEPTDYRADVKQLQQMYSIRTVQFSAMQCGTVTVFRKIKCACNRTYNECSISKLQSL